MVLPGKEMNFEMGCTMECTSCKKELSDVCEFAQAVDNSITAIVDEMRRNGGDFLLAKAVLMSQAIN